MTRPGTTRTSRAGRVRGRRRAGQDLSPGGDRRRQRLHGGPRRGEVSRGDRLSRAQARHGTKNDRMMDWDRVRVFHAVAQAGSFTRAAERLGLSQSAISRQIGALEEDLGTPLFHRHARGLVLTEQGEILLAGGRRGRQADGRRSQTALGDSRDCAGRASARQHHDRPRHGLAGRRSCPTSSSVIRRSASR